ncbi:9749_t:CDS:1, partial [Funneliformis geosporum]
ANNLYGWAMSQYLPIEGFQWLDLNNLPDIQSISLTTKRGSAWEVKLKYPDHLHRTHTEYPLCPERRIVKRQELGSHQNNNLIDILSRGKFAETEKLVATLETKNRYIIHYRNLQQCLELGMELEHVY